jgi:hypothetical protein
MPQRLAMRKAPKPFASLHRRSGASATATDSGWIARLIDVYSDEGTDA